MDITIDTGENKIIVHLEKYSKKGSFAVLINHATSTTVQVTVDELINALKVISSGDKENV